MMGKLFKVWFIALISTGIFFSCERKDPAPEFDVTDFRSEVQRLSDSGNLLQSWIDSGDDYLFKFDTQSLSVLKDFVKNIEEKPDEWKTIVFFTDGSQLSIPSFGGDLSFIVKNLVLNPSGYNPLSAKLEVLLPTPGRVKIIVNGKDGKTGTISHLFNETTARQHLPILGLYGGYDNKVDVVYTNMEGKERGRTQLQITTEPLNIPNFPDILVKVSKPEKMEPGVSLVTHMGESILDTSLPFMVDENGEVRWVLIYKGSKDFDHFSYDIGLKRTKKGTYISGDISRHRIVEFDVFGNLIKEWDLAAIGYAFHHEITETPEGTFLVTVSKNSAKLANGNPRINDFIIELEPGSGKILKEWDLITMLDSARIEKVESDEPEEFLQSKSNWIHNNSINKIGDDYLASGRYQGVFSFDKSGEVKWILSPHKGWGAAYQKKLLTPLDKNGNIITDPEVLLGRENHPDFEYPWGQHCAIELPNGNILLFDNGLNRNFKTNFSPGTQNFSRAVEYKINKKNNTVQQIWEYGKTRGDQTFSVALSGVDYLEKTGNILFNPGLGVKTQKGSGGSSIEIDPKTNEVVFEFEVTTSSILAFQRVYRMPLYPENL